METCDLIKDLGIVAETLEAVSAAHWNIECAPVVGGQFHAFPFKIGRRTDAKIHGDIEDGAARAADDLGFRKGRPLEMKPAQCAATRVVGQAFLCDLRIQSMRRQFVAAPAAREEASLIADRLHIEDFCAMNAGRRDDHDSRPERWIFMVKVTMKKFS